MVFRTPCLFPNAPRASIKFVFNLPFLPPCTNACSWLFGAQVPFSIPLLILILVLLQEDSASHKGTSQISRHINDCFSQLKCFLMPHPGLRVRRNAFKGRLSELEPDFREQMLYLIPSLLSSENLIVKEINGEHFTCAELYEYFKTYTNAFGSGELPQPISSIDATAEANNRNAFTKGLQYYNGNMDAVSSFWVNRSLTDATYSIPWFRREIILLVFQTPDLHRSHMQSPEVSILFIVHQLYISLPKAYINFEISVEN